MIRGLEGRRSEAGETMLEVLLASALLALVVIGIVGGIATMVIGTHVHRDQSESNAALVSAMENLKSPGVTRLCPVSPATLPAYTLPANVSMTVEYEVTGTGGAAFGWSATPADCATDPANPLTLQRITLKYTHPGSTNVAPQLQFIKG